MKNATLHNCVKFEPSSLKYRVSLFVDSVYKQGQGYYSWLEMYFELIFSLKQGSD